MDTETLRLQFEEMASDPHFSESEEMVTRTEAWRRYFKDMAWRPVLDIVCAEMFDWDPSMADLNNGYQFKISTIHRPPAELHNALHMQYIVFEPSPDFLTRFADVVQRTLTALTAAGYDARIGEYWDSDDGEHTAFERVCEWEIVIPRPTQPSAEV